MSSATTAKFPKGVPMDIEDVAAVVGESFKKMNEDPPASVIKVREEMQGKKADARVRLTWASSTTAAEEEAPKEEPVKEEPVKEEPVKEEKPKEEPAAKAASGLYGYPKAIQRSAEAASRKLARAALRVAKRVFARDAEVVPFLQAHAKREGSKSARVLLAAMKEIGPKLASEMRGGMPREAGKIEYGLYGFKAKTADLGLDACKEVRSAAGRIAADVHLRKGDLHEKITGFFKEHSKQAKCAYSGMLFSCYPDATMKVASKAGDVLTDPSLVREFYRVGSSNRFVRSGGALRDLEVLPSDFAEFRASVLEKAAGTPESKITFTATPRPGAHVAAHVNEDGSSRDVEGEAYVKATWDGGGTIGQYAFTGLYVPETKPEPKKTVLASGDWIEWED